MPSFNEQFAQVSTVIDGFCNGQERLTFCIGSGVSRRVLPMLPRLFARVFVALKDDAQTSALFDRYDHELGLSARVPGVPNPLHLADFLTLPEERQDLVCSLLCTTEYGLFFQELQTIAGSKRQLLAAMGFEDFLAGDPPPAHQFLAALISEGQADVLTTNWDLLLEKAAEGIDTPLTVVMDEGSWLGSRGKNAPVLTKFHGSATQYPDNADRIILTTDEQDGAVGGWRREVASELLNRKCLFSGYSNSDYTLRVPVNQITQLRNQAALPTSDYFVAQPGNLRTQGEMLTRRDPTRHLRLAADDVFCTSFFFWLRSKFLTSLQGARGWTVHQIPFTSWDGTEWTAALDTAGRFLEHEFGSLLDSLFGSDSLTRDFGLAASTARALTKTYELMRIGSDSGRSYVPFRNQLDQDQDVVLLIILSAVVRSLSGSSCAVSFDSSGHALITHSAARQQLLIYRGQFATSAVGALTDHLNMLEDNGMLPAPEVVIIPCSHYRTGAIADLIRSTPAILKGSPKARRTFISPEDIFESVTYADLVEVLRGRLSA